MAVPLLGERGIVTPDGNYPFPSSSPELDPLGISYEIMRWHDFELMVQVLGDKVEQDGKVYDAVVSLLRGGRYPGEELANKLFLPHDTIKVKLYRDIQAGQEATQNKPDIEKKLSHPD